MHRAAIERLREPDEDEESEANRALECLNRTPEQHNINALGKFARGNKVRQLRRLAPITDVNGLDSHGSRALDGAVNEKQTEAVRMLLEHGADPNLVDCHGDPCLHDAARKFNNAEIISLLIEHGADVNALDKEGRTPLDCAIENGRRSNAKLLRIFGAKPG